MKALCQSAWLLTVAFGNLVVVIIAESSIFENQVRPTLHTSWSLSLSFRRMSFSFSRHQLKSFVFCSLECRISTNTLIPACSHLRSLRLISELIKTARRTAERTEHSWRKERVHLRHITETIQWLLVMLTTPEPLKGPHPLHILTILLSIFTVLMIVQ